WSSRRWEPGCASSRWWSRWRRSSTGRADSGTWAGRAPRRRSASGPCTPAPWRSRRHAAVPMHRRRPPRAGDAP
ncbi:MAG: hypothetical protein AVDCRST_MAG16-1091, partial [uncultured Frankineae bacterium]